MSDEDEAPKREVGYGRPPGEHKFPKGVSGNSKGRPRKPKRLFAPRQVRRDILAITEAPVTLQTPDGEIVVPTFVAVLMVARKKALSGHGPSIRLLLDRHNLAILEHWDLRRGAQFTPETLEGEMRLFERIQDENEILKRPKRRRRR